MRAQNWTDVMTLLAVMVISNHNDKDSETSVFNDAALRVRDLAAPNVKLTESFAKDWMDANRSNIIGMTSSINYEAAVKQLTARLECLVDKNIIMTSIMKSIFSAQELDEPVQPTLKSPRAKTVNASFNPADIQFALAG